MTTPSAQPTPYVPDILYLETVSGFARCTILTSNEALKRASITTGWYVSTSLDRQGYVYLRTPSEVVARGFAVQANLPIEDLRI